MNDAAALPEIEAIKRLKARYCRYLDTKDWQAWRSLFADDFLSDTSGRTCAATATTPRPTRSRRAVGLRERHADPAARGHLQRVCGGVYLGPDSTSDREGSPPGDEMTAAPVAYPASTALGRFSIASIMDSPDPFVSSMPLERVSSRSPRTLWMSSMPT